MARKRRVAKRAAALSDDAASDDLELRPAASVSVEDEEEEDDVASDPEPPRKTDLKSKASATPKDESEEVEEDEGDDDDDDEDLGEDEFIVEAIKKHMADADGSLKFLVKWEGYNKKSDMTWEPEDNLMESASDILAQYYNQIGGRDSIFEESQVASRSKKRGRTSTGTPSTTKRPRKNGLHPADSTPPASARKWSPPAGSWEDEIESIDACHDEGSGKLAVFLIWNNGKKTKHDTTVVYKKCPQKMLQFYERHIKVIREENQAAGM
ncbi:hypothetical protein CDD80_802 [Ophiocordyceps camponoti-rufipedis]|uniref:Chromo domain-containing protein n=1 Tax=Ophiocordyceps camponoti-rufipedis TaxID=2004952 RepID=A0A2C5ZBI4_9HYPO|nr:hypothetical protein CDD80_802 [Ophiocordyceps camponoti-rufipedis]